MATFAGLRYLLAGLGLRAMIQLRTWGVFAVGTAGALLISLAGVEIASSANDLLALKPALGGSLLLLAAAPWATPILRSLR